MRWRESSHGQHIELGIAEGNLVGLLGELGATWSRAGLPLLPIGALYDPFVNRALEPWSFGIYAGGQSILVGTPSGVTLAPEGGAHQSIITPSVGLEQPRCVAWEPAFGQDLEWTLLAALGSLGHSDGTSAYFRLSTRPVDQTLAGLPDDPAAREERRRQVLAGGYLLRVAERRARRRRSSAWAPCSPTCSPRRTSCRRQVSPSTSSASRPPISSSARCRRGRGSGDGDTAILDALFPPTRRAPIVTRAGRPSRTRSRSSRPSARCRSRASASTTSASRATSRISTRHFGIDTETIIGAALDLTDAGSR